MQRNQHVTADDTWAKSPIPATTVAAIFPALTRSEDTSSPTCPGASKRAKDPIQRVEEYGKPASIVRAYDSVVMADLSGDSSSITKEVIQLSACTNENQRRQRDEADQINLEPTPEIPGESDEAFLLDPSFQLSNDETEANGYTLNPEVSRTAAIRPSSSEHVHDVDMSLEICRSGDDIIWDVFNVLGNPLGEAFASDMPFLDWQMPFVLIT
ncbi:hypothetical protein BJY01DRAFT_255099 [Aspergillus pseudoustus]|uniref:Uncharacterized protein n=1 Tax=Aspergillus pseudoustus TaxID=1810923 RepID=A0ABR4IQP6_9EURO